MTYTIAPACRALLTQATLRYPKRNRASDGTIGDAKHRARRSWHNPSLRDGTPDPSGTVLAVDLTHDPDNGCDAHQLVRDLVAKHDRRVSEAISQGQIWTRARAAEGWRPYRGSNPHDKHAHITVAWLWRNSTDPWWPQEDDMALSDEDVQRIADAVYKRTNGDAVAILRGPNHPSLTKILALLTKIATKLEVKP